MKSNLVGESTQAKNACGDSRRACNMGSAKAPVLPEPVCASPIRSLPVKLIYSIKNNKSTRNYQQNKKKTKKSSIREKK